MNMNPENSTRKKEYPLIVSASRATDIPAFHSGWFMERLKAGGCVWRNPFNARQSTWVSFEKTKVFVFWTKNPAPLIPCLQKIEDRGYHFYFQYTINDYEKEGLEPNVPALARRMETFRKLSDIIGKERVIWRFDPVILGGSLSTGGILEKIRNIGNTLYPYTEKLVFSFVDMYRKTQNNLKKIDPSLRAPTKEEMYTLAEGIASVNKSWSNQLDLATCAEEMSFEQYGIQKNKCIDDQLILRLCPDDPELGKLFLKNIPTDNQCSLPGVSIKTVKDKGQRKYCGCVKSKDIGEYSTCMYLCAYCYANQSPKAVISNINKQRAGAEEFFEK